MKKKIMILYQKCRLLISYKVFFNIENKIFIRESNFYSINLDCKFQYYDLTYLFSLKNDVIFGCKLNYER